MDYNHTYILVCLGLYTIGFTTSSKSENNVAWYQQATKIGIPVELGL